MSPFLEKFSTFFIDYFKIMLRFSVNRQKRRKYFKIFGMNFSAAPTLVLHRISYARKRRKQKQQAKSLTFFFRRAIIFICY